MTKQKHTMVKIIMDASLLLRLYWHTFGITHVQNKNGCQPTIKNVLAHFWDHTHSKTKMDASLLLRMYWHTFGITHMQNKKWVPAYY
jgi:hypothetical protein